MPFNVFNLSQSGVIHCLLPHPTRHFILFLTLSPGFITRISRCCFTLYRESSRQDSVFIVCQAAAKPPSPVPVLSTALPDEPGLRCGFRRRCTGSPSPSFSPSHVASHSALSASRTNPPLPSPSLLQVPVLQSLSPFSPGKDGPASQTKSGFPSPCSSPGLQYRHNWYLHLSSFTSTPNIRLCILMQC